MSVKRQATCEAVTNRLFCERISEIVFAPEDRESEEMEGRRYSKAEMVEALVTDARFRQRVTERFKLDADVRYCDRLAEVALRLKGKGHPPLLELEQKPCSEEEFSAAMQRNPALRQQMAEELGYGPNEQYCERLVELAFAPIVQLEGKAFNQGSLRVALVENKKGFRRRVAEWYHNDRSPVDWEKLVEELVEIAFERPKKADGKVYTEEEFRAALLTSPKLQQKMAVLYHYVPSKWLVEQEMLARGIWPGGPAAPDVYRVIAANRLMGVCFSGGGIRSATFNLGMTQGLAQLGLLPCIDYLSSVSGGGYIHEFLAAWILRHPKGSRGVIEELIPQAEPGCLPRAPEPIKWLMRYSSYLTPARGIFSTDTWTMMAIWFRNTILNQIPIMAGLSSCIFLLHLLVPVPTDPRNGRTVSLVGHPWWADGVLRFAGLATIIWTVVSLVVLARNLSLQRRMGKAESASKSLNASWIKLTALVAKLLESREELFKWASTLSPSTKFDEQALPAEPGSSIGGAVAPIAATGTGTVMKWIARKYKWSLLDRSTSESSSLEALAATAGTAYLVATQVPALGEKLDAAAARLKGLAEKLANSPEVYSAHAEVVSSASQALIAAVEGWVASANLLVNDGSEFVASTARIMSSLHGLNSRADELSTSVKKLDSLALKLDADAAKLRARADKHKPQTLLTNGAVQLRIILPWLGFSVWMSYWVETLSRTDWRVSWFPAGASSVLVLAVAFIVIYPGGAIGINNRLNQSMGLKKSKIAWFLFGLAGLLSSAFAMVLGIGFSIGSGWIATHLSKAIGTLDTLTIDPWRIRLTILPGPLLSIPYVAVELTLGLLGRNYSDARREWLARLRAWSLLYALLWTSLVGLVLLGPYFVYFLAGKGGPWLYSCVATFVAAHAATIFAGWSGKADGKPTDKGILGLKPMDLLALVASPIAIASMMIVLAFASSWMVDFFYSRLLLAGGFWGRFWLADSICLLLSAFLALVFGRRVDINDFSMESFYRNRLSRCYLGATVPDRQPDPFTGFDDRGEMKSENLRAQRLPPLVSDLLPNKFTSKHDWNNRYDGPFPIFCTTLNLTTGDDLATQERKGTSFAFTPLYSGYSVPWTDGKRDANVSYNGYVPTRDYAYGEGGIGLDTAVAISGAALNPNMGYNSSPALTFLMTFFNVRLGWWISNPRKTNSWQASNGRATPPFALTYLFQELFGMVNDGSTYVNLSDGGHFEDMGLYELVRRRCSYIVVCDAENDPEMKFDGMGLAITKCRADFGAEIDLDLRPLRIDAETGYSDTHCVVGTIRYPPPLEDRGPMSGADEATACECLGDEGDDDYTGIIVYLKSSLVGDEPADLLAYKLRHDVFPQDSTANQWFTESQFEAYRRLGHHVAMTAIQPALSPTETKLTDDPEHIEKLFDRLYAIWYPRTPEMEKHLADHLKQYEAILTELRQRPELVGLEERLSTTGDQFEWRAPMIPPQSDLYATQFANSLLDFMYTVYTNLQLAFPDNLVSPHAEWWVCLFRRWCRVSLVRSVWRTHVPGYPEEFRLFARRELKLPEEKPYVE